MLTTRRSGILLHPTSLPGRYGIGSFNDDAYNWVDFLYESKQSLWQVLPLGPTGYGDSPYQSFSSFAGNPYLISLEALVQMGLLDHHRLDQAPSFRRDQIDYGAIYYWKLPLLRAIAAEFDARAGAELKAEFAEFSGANSAWLDDYALFMALITIAWISRSVASYSTVNSWLSTSNPSMLYSTGGFVSTSLPSLNWMVSFDVAPIREPSNVTISAFFVFAWYFASSNGR